MVTDVFDNLSVAVGFIEHSLPFRIGAKTCPCFSPLIGVFERNQICEFVIAIPYIGRPVADVLDAVLFEQLESVVGKSSLEIRKSSRQAFVHAKFVKHRVDPLTSDVTAEPFLVLARF